MANTFVEPELIVDDLVARQGQTLVYEFALFESSVRVHTIFASDTAMDVLAQIKTCQPHCLEVGQKVNLSNAKCVCPLDVTCFTVAEIVSNVCFTVEEPIEDGYGTQCPVCTGGEINVPVDLTGVEFCGQVRPSFSASEYQPPVKGTIKAGTNLLVLPSCDGCNAPQVCDYIDVPDACIVGAVIQKITKGNRAGGCNTGCLSGCQLELNVEAAKDAKLAPVTLNTAVLGEFTVDLADADCGIVRLMLDTTGIPIPWCCQVGLPGCKGEKAYGPHKWDLMMKTALGNFFIRTGSVYMLPSVTIAA